MLYPLFIASTGIANSKLVTSSPNSWYASAGYIIVKLNVLYLVPDDVYEYAFEVIFPFSSIIDDLVAVYVLVSASYVYVTFVPDIFTDVGLYPLNSGIVPVISELSNIS